MYLDVDYFSLLHIKSSVAPLVKRLERRLLPHVLETDIELLTGWGHHKMKPEDHQKIKDNIIN